MTQREFEMWRAYFRQHPFDDRHRYHRPAALVARASGGAEVGKNLEWLSPEPTPPGLSESDGATLSAFGLTIPMRH